MYAAQNDGEQTRGVEDDEVDVQEMMKCGDVLEKWKVRPKVDRRLLSRHASSRSAHVQWVFVGAAHLRHHFLHLTSAESHHIYSPRFHALSGNSKKFLCESCLWCLSHDTLRFFSFLFFLRPACKHFVALHHG